MVYVLTCRLLVTPCTNMANMQQESLAFLRKWREDLVSQQLEIEKRISYLDELINDHEGDSTKGELIGLPSPVRSKRVRGVFAAARRVIDQFSGPFDKYQLWEKLKEDEEFAGKEISESNIRNALRLLKENGVIKIESEATATKRATYVKAA